jgi:hypothetical protein
VVHSHSSYSPNKPKVVQVLLVAETRERIDLECVVIPENQKRGRVLRNFESISGTHIAEYSNKP